MDTSDTSALPESTEQVEAIEPAADSNTADTSEIENVDSDVTESEEADEQAPEKAPSRLERRFSELTGKIHTLESEREMIAQERQRMQEQNAMLLERLTRTPEVEEQKVDMSKYDPEKLQELKMLMKEVGLSPLEQKYATLEKSLQDATSRLAEQEQRIQREQDLSARNTTLAKYKDIVTEDELVNQVKSWEKSTDPREKLKSQLPYDDIVRLMKFEKLAQREVDATLKAKPKALPKVVSAKDQKAPAPSKAAFKWDPNNPAGSLERLKQHALAGMVEDDA